MDAQALITNPDSVRDAIGLPDEYLSAMGRLMSALDYPVSPPDDDGITTTFDMSFMKAIAAYHLARCGFDIARDPLIHKQRVSGPGIIEGACQWPEVGEGNSPIVYASPLDDLENMTINQINALPEPLKREAYLRMGWPYTDESGWNAAPAVNIEDAPEADDGAEWTHDG